MQQAPTDDRQSVRTAVRLAGIGAAAMAAGAGLLWLRYGGEVFAAALQAVWTCF